MPTKPPIAPRRPVVQELHGTTVEDPYAWLRQRESAEVLEALAAENAYTEALTADQGELRETLYREMVARIPEVDEKVPSRRGRFLYGQRLDKAAQYPVFWRRPVSEDPREESAAEDGPCEVLLDLEELAKSHDYLSLGVLRVSPDDSRLAYTLDVDGSELYRLRVLDLETRQLLDDPIDGVYWACEWAGNSETLFYVTRDAARRPYRLHRHRLGDPPEADVLVYEERDERFFLSLEKTRSGRFLLMTLGTHSTSEVWVIDAAKPEAPPRLVAPRSAGIEWQLDHWHPSGGGALAAGAEEESDDGRFYLCTNSGDAANFRLLSCPASGPPGAGGFLEEVAERDGVVLERVDCWRDHLALSIRTGGLSALEIHPLDGGPSHRVELDEEVGSVSLIDNQEFETPWLRFVYQSPVTPRSIFDYHAESRERRLRKRSKVHGHDPGLYRCRRLQVEADDGVLLPVSWVERADRQPGGPVMLYAYGSYGMPLEPNFSIARLSLLDRGFAVGLVHARGGGEMGRPWYEAAKLGRKERTFKDVVAVGEHLVKSGRATPRQLMLRGGSAGGLTVGAVINRRPDLFHAALAEVPFVDVLNTMLDPSIPLTVIEFEEWGDPGSSAEAFEWIRRYSPYENVRRASYPHLLVTAGLNDPRVQYWEPAKWVARLRHESVGDNLLLLRVDMGSGHKGASGRFDSLRQEAFKLAFLLDCAERDREDASRPR
ncbi:MAG: S9 family peptidase [Acidobacteriota bacterium]